MSAEYLDQHCIECNLPVEVNDSVITRCGGVVHGECFVEHEESCIDCQAGAETAQDYGEQDSKLLNAIWEEEVHV